jgi:hypothetical protein
MTPPPTELTSNDMRCLGGESAAAASQTLADLITSSSRIVSFRSTGSTWFAPRPALFCNVPPIDRITAEQPYYSGKKKHHG